MKMVEYNGYVFTEVKEMFGHTNFRDFEKEYNEVIVYADSSSEVVISELLTPDEFDEDDSLTSIYWDIELYYFDGWFIAMSWLYSKGWQTLALYGILYLR